MNYTEIKQVIREEIHTVLKEIENGSINLEKTTNPSDIKKYTSQGIDVNLNEMAKIAGELKTAIEKVINDNPELMGLALKKVIRSTPEVISALAGSELYDNQLNQFISAVKGEREIGQRGRPKMDMDSVPNPNKPIKPTFPLNVKPKVSTPKPPVDAEIELDSDADEYFKNKDGEEIDIDIPKPPSSKKTKGFDFKIMTNPGSGKKILVVTKPNGKKEYTDIPNTLDPNKYLEKIKALLIK
jgi:hypothetical protein